MEEHVICSSMPCHAMPFAFRFSGWGRHGSNLKHPSPYNSFGNGQQFPQIVGRKSALSSWCTVMVLWVGDVCFAKESISCLDILLSPASILAKAWQTPAL